MLSRMLLSSSITVTFVAFNSIVVRYSKTTGGPAVRTGASWEMIHLKNMRLERVYLLFDRKPTLFKVLLIDGGGEVVDGGGEVVDGGGEVVDGGGEVVDGGGEVVDGGGEVVVGQVVLTVWRRKSKEC